MSANAEDITIYDAFFSGAQFRGGNHTYMEIGAHDGVRESNSRFYDICLGWNGLLVEPHPKNYERAVHLRPNAIHLGIAPSCMANESGTVLFPKHMYTSAQVNAKGSEIEIHCGPLQYYLDSLEIRHIDFWSLDVEGSELKVLQTVDFDRTHIDVIIAESANRLSHLPEIQKKVKDVRLYLQRKGYLMIKSVMVKKSDVFLHKRACGSHENIEECKVSVVDTQIEEHHDLMEKYSYMFNQRRTLINASSVIVMGYNQRAVITSQFVQNYFGSEIEMVPSWIKCCYNEKSEREAAVREFAKPTLDVVM